MISSKLKRLIDVLVSISGLILLSPLFLALACAVRTAMGGPILFRQVRVGLDGAEFELMKFRTMTDGPCESRGVKCDEERLTKLGRFMRRWSLDELPELVNVLRGEMSTVGPRPLLPRYMPRYNTRQIRRHEVRPGLTGWAQINGRNGLPWVERLEADVWYVENRSTILDFKIMARTFRIIAAGSGISEAGSATMSEFLGREEGP